MQVRVERAFRPASTSNRENRFRRDVADLAAEAGQYDDPKRGPEGPSTDYTKTWNALALYFSLPNLASEIVSQPGIKFAGGIKRSKVARPSRAAASPAATSLFSPPGDTLFRVFQQTVKPAARCFALPPES
jgi:hypothetical protein